MQTKTNKIKFNFIDIIFILFLYQLYWFIDHYNFPNTIKFSIVIISITYQIFSIERSIAILLMAIFIPFLSIYIGTGFLRLEKIFSLIFIIKYFTLPDKQKIKYDKRFFFGVAIILSLLIFQFLFLIKYPSFHEEQFSIKNSIASIYDFIIVILIYVALFKKIEYRYITTFFMYLIMIYAISMATSIILMVIQNPQELYSETSSGLMWRNEFFGHKNAWGLFYGLFCLATFYFIVNKDNGLIDIKKKYLVFAFILSFICLCLSLSRRAMMVFLAGTLYLLKNHFNIKTIALLIVLILGVFIYKPDFLYTRFESLTKAESISDIQDASAGQLSSEAINQLVNRISIIPKFFVEGWEYNLSEGFYGELLFRTGIIGLLIYIIFTFSLLFVKRKNFNNLYNVYILFFLFAGLGYRHAFLSNIYGSFAYMNLLVTFFVFFNLINFEENKV